MSVKFEFPTNPHDDVRLYRKKNIELNPGITVLVGCNGIGKTTFLTLIKEELKKIKMPYISFDNLQDGGSNSRAEAGFFGDMGFLATALLSSEGENIMMNIGKQATKIGRFVKEHPDTKELWLLFDATDSGLSIDNVCEIKEYLFKTILEDPRNKDKEIYIIVSANEYEMANGEQCFDVYAGKYLTFKNYEDYKTFILESRQKKEKRK